MNYTIRYNGTLVVPFIDVIIFVKSLPSSFLLLPTAEVSFHLLLKVKNLDTSFPW